MTTHQRILKWSLILIIVPTIFSCKTTKEVAKTENIYDSVARKENKALRRFLSEEIERFEKEREQWESTGVVFDNPCPDSASITSHGNAIIPTKIIFDNGKIKSIEGRVKSLNQSLYEKSSELLDAHRTIDSLQYELEKEQTSVKKEVKTIHKHTKTKVTGWPVWLFAICFVGGCLIEYKYKIVKRILSFKLRL